MSGFSAEPPANERRTINRGTLRSTDGAGSDSTRGRSSMKSIFQWGAAAVVLFGGVFLVTFLTQYSRTKDVTTDTPAPTAGPVAPLKPNEKTAVWDSSDTQYVQEFDKGVTAHYDFLVSNSNDKPVTVILESKFSCTCTNLDVQVGLIAAAMRAKLNAAKPVPSGAQVEPYVAGVRWKSIVYERDQKPIEETIPAADTNGPQWAAIRMSWETKEIKATTLKAQIHARLGSTAAEFINFDVPIAIVPLFQAAPPDLQFGDLNPGEKREKTFHLWSATKDYFNADVHAATADPCIEVGEPRPLTADELKKLPDELLAAGLITSKTRPKSGYVVSVTVYESRGDNQLELGPLARRLLINRTSEGEATVMMTGTVRGSIHVGEPVDNERIDLRTFPAIHGTEKMVNVKSAEPGLALTVDHVKPAELQITLRPPATAGLGTRIWKLIVTAPPNALAGPLPADSAIYLKTNTTPPRRIRIPLHGNASG
jgi:hypothetical protein